MMQHQSPTLVKGTRDFNATQVCQRNYLLNTIRHRYQQYGFAPLETPAMEHLSTLTGKYGPEGDQLLFKLLNSGDFLTGVEVTGQHYKTLLPQIAEKGLRYDLTVPLMRYVAMNKGQLTFPFKRYQMQPVWRADRPQKGRYREFYQCDLDVVGTSSLLCEAEILVLVHKVLHQLGIRDFTIHLNHRGVLKGLAVALGAAEQEQALCVALDKLDKVGLDKVHEELLGKGFAPAAIAQLTSLLDLPGTTAAKLAYLTEKLVATAAGLQGLQALEEILAYVQALGLDNTRITFDPCLARGLAYYTGAIFEVKLSHMAVGSLGGGGRYDGLTDLFGLPGVSGVGFSFGMERLYTVMEENQLFPKDLVPTPKLMLTHMDAASLPWALEVLTALRAHDIAVELYPDAVKLKKQLQYAHQRHIPFVALIGEAEKRAHEITLKNMHTGTQQSCTLAQLLQLI